MTPKSWLTSLSSGAAATVDRAATFAASASSRRARRSSAAEQLTHAERIAALDAITDAYRDDAGLFFRGPREIDPTLYRQQPLQATPSLRVEVADAYWRSAYTCFLPELDERYGKYTQNHSAAARLFQAPSAERRPVIVLIHGYLGGQYAAESRIWPVKWLLKRGLDVALFVLPFHGVRQAPERRGPPPFPGADPRVTNEGFRQAMGDLRDLIGFLRGRGHPQVGVMGMSLGGYSTALLATLDAELAFAVPLIPLASLADFARDHGRLGSQRESQSQHAALDRAHRVVSPLHRPLRLESHRVLVIGAEADQITPIKHARRLANHFHTTMETWPGGHLLQLGRSDAFRRVGHFVSELGVTA